MKTYWYRQKMVVAEGMAEAIRLFRDWYEHSSDPDENFDGHEVYIQQPGVHVELNLPVVGLVDELRGKEDAFQHALEDMIEPSWGHVAITLHVSANAIPRLVRPGVVWETRRA